MGCGQSKILIYSRKSKADKHEKHNNNGGDDCYSDATLLQQQDGDGIVAPETQLQLQTSDCDSNLFESSEISTSQIDFFKMLDEKIENGPDYEENEQDRELERQRLLKLLSEWLRRPQLDTQRFPTAYHACPPGRAPGPPPLRYGPRQPIYPPPRPYQLSRAVSVETSQIDRYMDYRREDMYADSDMYGVPQEPAYGYSRSMLQNAAAYVSPIDTTDIYARTRPPLATSAGRAISFDAGHYDMGPAAVAGPSEYVQRGRDTGLTQHLQYKQHSALQYPAPPSHVMYGMGGDMGQEQLLYLTRPPPREMPPLQGVPGPPPPHGSPRPVAVRLPTSVAWRRPRGPVTELA